MSNHRLISSLNAFADATILCIGDVMLDHYVYGGVGRISPEAPIPVLAIDREESMLGGAGNVVRNITSLGAQVLFLTVTGEDAAGDSIASLLNGQPRCTALVLRDPARRTTVKTRYLAQNQQLLRVDAESTAPISPAILDQLTAAFAEGRLEADVVILSDYAKGVLGHHAQRFIAPGKPVYVDPKGRDFQRYRGATLLKPNLKELAEAAKLPVQTALEVEAAARALMLETDVEAVLATRGATGMMLVRRDAPAVEFHSRAREVYDVSGAGDTVAAALAVGSAAGLSLEDAVELACIAAGLVVGKLGAATVTPEELRRELGAR